MSRKSFNKIKRGYFGIGVENLKTPANFGTLFRTASVYGASNLWVTGKRFKPQSSDTQCSHRHIPVTSYIDFDDFYEHIPYDCVLVGVEMTDNARPLEDFTHPVRAYYLLGSEDRGLTDSAIAKCRTLIKLPGKYSINVATAGSIVMYDRLVKTNSNGAP